MKKSFRCVWPRLVAGVMPLALAALACAGTRVQPTLSTPAPISATDQPSSTYLPGTYVETLETGGQTRSYRLHVPTGYQPGMPLPLVINVHGLGSNAEEQERLSGMSARADNAGFIVVYPEALGAPSTWHVGPGADGAADLAFMRDLINHLSRTLSVDPNRIYATGMSNGGGMVNRMACDMSDVVVAIGPVSGAYLFWNDCHPQRAVPVVAFHGTDDRIVPYEGEGRSLPPVREWAAAWAERNGCDPDPIVTYQQGEVTGETWSGCRDDATVTLYTVDGRGHAWPGSEIGLAAGTTTEDIVATEAIWEFFAAHPAP